MKSYACILKIFVIMFLLPINFMIYFEICSTPKESKCVSKYYYSHTTLPNEFQYNDIHQD